MTLPVCLFPVIVLMFVLEVLVERLLGEEVKHRKASCRLLEIMVNSNRVPMVVNVFSLIHISQILLLSSV